MLKDNAHKLAKYLLDNIQPTSCGNNYGYLKKGGNLHGMTFELKDNEKLPLITQVQLTKRTRFFRSDLEVYIIVKNVGSETLEAIDFDGELFDRVFNKYFENIKAKEQEKINKRAETFLKAINNLMG